MSKEEKDESKEKVSSETPLIHIGLAYRAHVICSLSQPNSKPRCQ
jgi:hypothetical protein